VTGCDHVRPDLGAYVLGALEPEEEAAVREHLTTCSECAAEHASVAGLPRLLALAAPMGDDGPPAPAPAVEERVLDAIAGERPRRAPRRRRLPRPRVLVPAAAALAAVVVAVVIAVGGGDERAPGFEVALQPVGGETASGRALLTSADAGIKMRLWVRGLPRDPGIVYEVQCDAPGWTASAGTFRADSRGRAYVVLNTAARRGEYDAIRVVRRTRSSATDVLEAQL
jgi:Putative zinc-finger